MALSLDRVSDSLMDVFDLKVRKKTKAALDNSIQIAKFDKEISFE